MPMMLKLKSVEPSVHPAETTPRVLVVDDDPDMLETARMVLESHGYRVDTAGDGRLGLSAARARHYDVVVLDVNMPGMDGTQLGQALRDDPATAARPLVFQTSLHEGAVRARFADYDAFVAKPGGPFSLVEAVAKVLHRDDAD